MNDILILWACIFLLSFVSCQPNPEVKIEKAKSEYADYTGKEVITIKNANSDDSRWYFDQDTSKLFYLLNPDSSGIQFNNQINENFSVNVWDFDYSVIGAGVAIGDINNDDLPDVFFTGNYVDNRLYLNKGNLEFEDITQSAGVQGSDGFYTGAIMADVNGDGWLDIYTCKAGNFSPEERENQLFINNGDLTFTEEGASFGINDPSYSVSAVFFDADLDHDLDLYVSNHPVDFREKYNPTNYDKIEKGVNLSDKFYLNEDGKFTERSMEFGINNHGYGLGVTAGDINMDGYPDLYISNDFAMNDHLYINKAGVFFEDQIKERTHKISQNSMGAEIEDFNNDGYFDILTTDLKMERCYDLKTFRETNRPGSYYDGLTQSGFHYQYAHNTLQLNNGIGEFQEMAEFAGLASTNWSWSSFLVDFDLDGLKDYFVSNGFYIKVHADQRENFRKLGSAIRNQDIPAFYYYRNLMPKKHLKFSNKFFKNTGNKGFENYSLKWDSGLPTTSYGAAYGDLDGDGDIDVITNNTNQKATVYINTASEKELGNYLKIRLLGPNGNNFGLGATVKVSFSNSEIQSRQLIGVRGYQSTSEMIAHFGFPEKETIKSVEVIWPGGNYQVKRDATPNSTLLFYHKDAKPGKIPLVSDETDPWFEKVKSDKNLSHRHKENFFDDFANQFLLHRNHSTEGPGIAVGDVNGDELEDVFVGGASGQPAALYLQDINGAFKFSEGPWASLANYENTGTLLFDIEGDGDLDIYFGSGGSEFLKDSEFYQDQILLNDGFGNFTLSEGRLPKSLSSTSCVIACDFDNDGDLDLFKGSRLIPQEYPLFPKSQLLQNENGYFTDVTEKLAPGLQKVGLVTSALWTDVNNDNQFDLIVLGEWMPVRIFQNENGSFVEVTDKAGLSFLTGWWNSISGGDFNNDGWTDYVVGNFGKNLNFQTSSQEPVELFYHDFNRDHSPELILTYHNQGSRYPVEIYDRIVEKIKDIEQLFPTYHDFASATVEDLFGEKELDKAMNLQANTFAHCLLLNDGKGGFKISELPRQTQISPVFGTLVYDFNNDGNQDILLHGNFYGMDPRLDRQASGKGFLLSGQGNGDFDVLYPGQSGFEYDADARSLVLMQRKGELNVLAAGSNAAMEAFKVRTMSKGGQNAPKDANYALISFPDGRIRKDEFYIGSGYLGQGTKVLSLPNERVGVEFVSNNISRIDK